MDKCSYFLYFAVLFGLDTRQFSEAELTAGARNSYILAPGKVLPGPIPTNSFKVTQNSSLSQCAAECSLEYHLNKFHCYAFEYVAPTRMCVLTNITTLVLKGGYLGLLPNDKINYYERSKGHYINLFQPYPGLYLEDQSSYFTVFHNMTLEKCALYCLIETRDTCMSFSFSANKQACGLSRVFYSKDNGQKLVHNDGGYNHYQYFTTWPCNATIPWNYAPRAIASPYFPYASVKDVSCHVTLEASPGKQVELTFSTLFSQSDLCRATGTSDRPIDTGITVYDGASNNDNKMARLCSSDNFSNRQFQSSSGYLHVHYATGAVPMAFKAVYNFIDVDPCQNNGCKNGATCVPRDGKFTCACAPGYTGTLCEFDIDDCASAPCYMGGKCVDLVNGFQCNCPPLLGGERCDNFVGLCYLNPCENGGTCSPRGTTAYVCDCPISYKGHNCSTEILDPCRDTPCLNGASCESDFTHGTFTCKCQPGFDGERCANNIDDCASNPCLHNIPCTDLVDDYHCQCPTFMGGKRCEAYVGKCHEQPCQHGACTPTGRDNYTCQCEQAYTGQHCETLFINYCQPNPCEHGQCTTFTDGPSCACDYGYQGFLCDQKVNHCDKVNCTQGECINKDDDFQCNCIPGFAGRFCNESINHCLAANCHGGFCINTVTSHFCVCKNGRTGSDCAPEVQHCGNLVCGNGTCVDHGDGVSSCECFNGYTGQECESTLDSCAANPCHYGNCTHDTSGVTCTCDDNYTGPHCDTIIDHCKDNQCVYGFCQNDANGFTCVCVQGYHGNNCQFRPGETPAPAPTPTSTSAQFTTIPVTVQNAFCNSQFCKYGSCDADFPSVCMCSLGYSGPSCEIFDGCKAHNPCLHGNCTDRDGGHYSCACENGFMGNNCETRDICAGQTCQYGACKAVGETAFRFRDAPTAQPENNECHAPKMDQSPQSPPTEFDIVRVAPQLAQVDLVLFSNVSSCYRSDKNITANYILGQDVKPTSWDWIGIFHSEWRLLGDYVAYRWSKAYGPDCTAPKRRAIVFPREIHQLQSHRTCTFQFLYVSRGNHVVGVSAPFRVYNEPELHEFSLNLLFLEHVKKTNAASGLNKSPKRKTKTQINGQFEAVNGPTPKKRKDKMTAVYKDNNSLVEVPSFNDWATKVGLYMSSPIVEEYNLSNAVVKYEPRQVIPVYNTRWSSRTIQEVLKTLPDTPAYMLPIAYPDLQPIKAGPVSLLGLTGSCSHCQVAKTMVIDLVEREALQEHKLDTIKQQLIKFEHEIDTIETQPVNVLDWAVTQLQEDNRGLKSRIDELEEKLADARTREENRLAELEEDPEPEPEDKEWSVRDPKRIVRLKKVLKRTSRNVKLLKQCNDNRNKQVLRLLADNNRLRRLVKGAIDTSNKFRAMSDELKMQVKCVLSARSKDVTNEWCRFTTQVKESTTQTSTNNTDAATSYDPKPSTTEDEKEESLPPVKQNMKNKQIARLIKAEKRQVARLHKEKGDAEKCPTCGLKFSKKADRRVIEEHIVFHQIMEK